MSIDIVPQLDSVFKNRIVSVADASLWEIHVPVEPSSFMYRLCDALYDVLEVQSWKIELPFSREEFQRIGAYLLEARVGYVFGIRSDTHPRDVRYPAIFGPILNSIGRYTDPEKSVVLIPCPTSQVEMDSEGHARALPGAKICKPEDYERIVMYLGSAGVPLNVGLPMDKNAPNDEIFRLAMTSEILSGAQTKAPTPFSLFARTLVEMTYLESLYGRARVTYATVSAMETGMRELVAMNVNGPKVRS